MPKVMGGEYERVLLRTTNRKLSLVMPKVTKEIIHYL
jgi:hypothetical protein